MSPAQVFMSYVIVLLYEFVYNDYAQQEAHNNVNYISLSAHKEHSDCDARSSELFF